MCRSALVAGFMTLRVRVPDAPLDLAEKVEATLLRQVPEVADQVCDGMLVPGAAVLLKHRDGLGGPCNMIGFIRHLSILLSRIFPAGTRLNFVFGAGPF